MTRPARQPCACKARSNQSRGRPSRSKARFQQRQSCFRPPAVVGWHPFQVFWVKNHQLGQLFVGQYWPAPARRRFLVPNTLLAHPLQSTPRGHRGPACAISKVTAKGSWSCEPSASRLPGQPVAPDADHRRKPVLRKKQRAVLSRIYCIAPGPAAALPAGPKPGTQTLNRGTPAPRGRVVPIGTGFGGAEGNPIDVPQSFPAWCAGC